MKRDWWLSIAVSLGWAVVSVCWVVGGLLSIVGCQGSGDAALACANACDRGATVMASYKEGECSCRPKTSEEAARPRYTSSATEFCNGCAAQCERAGKKVARCQYGGNTWGNGPDICECEGSVVLREGQRVDFRALPGVAVGADGG